MKISAMLDLECLSTRTDGAVIAVSFCTFSRDHIFDSVEFLINPRLSPGHRCRQTLQWWLEQDPQVFKRMMSGELSPWETCDRISEFLNLWPGIELWANSPSFDVVLLRHLFQACEKEFPIHFSQERDYRTIRKMAEAKGVQYQKPLNQRAAHDATEDAIAQAQALQLMLEGLNLAL